MHIHTYVHAYIYIYIYIYTYTYVYIYKYMLVYICIYICIYKYRSIDIIYYLSIFTHIVDGAVGAQWLSAFKTLIENPTTMLL
jgi:hypothetical protein